MSSMSEMEYSHSTIEMMHSKYDKFLSKDLVNACGSGQDHSQPWLLPDQEIAVIPRFNLESGATLLNVPVAFKRFGTLSPSRDNVVIVCHALSGSADIESWWRPLLHGDDRVVNTSKFCVICFNSLGSPYGTASPLTYRDGDFNKGTYGPDFPLTTVRDDVRLFKMVLDRLRVRQIVTVIGGSMGGMLVLEFAYFGKDYVKSIVPISTSASYSAWGIGWGEMQRQCIFGDPKYREGWYPPEDPPMTGLAAARMAAMLSYRSCMSFQRRFGRTEQQAPNPDDHWISEPPQEPALAKTPTYRCAQSYLQYQGEKFNKRFDANCYIALTHKLDTHDVSRDRVTFNTPPEKMIREALSLIEQPTLILGIESDVLFTFSEQQELKRCVPNSTLSKIVSEDGHDGFLLEMEQLNHYLRQFLGCVSPKFVPQTDHGKRGGFCVADPPRKRRNISKLWRWRSKRSSFWI